MKTVEGLDISFLAEDGAFKAKWRSAIIFPPWGTIIETAHAGEKMKVYTALSPRVSTLRSCLQLSTGARRIPFEISSNPEALHESLKETCARMYERAETKPIRMRYCKDISAKTVTVQNGTMPTR